MAPSRREFLGDAAAVLIKAVAFDAFTVFDPGPVFALAEAIFPGRGAELSAAWRTRQFEYTWLRPVAGHYADFWTVTGDALVFAASTLGLDLSADRRQRLMNAWLDIKAHPDAVPALTSLRQAGLRLRFLTNLTAPMIEAAVRGSGLTGFFEDALSTDRVRTYKPDPRAYSMGVEAFGLRREEIAFAAFGGWDAAGATWFGYPTFWVNRLGLPVEQLGVAPDGVGRDLADLARFVVSPPAR